MNTHTQHLLRWRITTERDRRQKSPALNYVWLSLYGYFSLTTSPSCQAPLLDPSGQWEYPDVSQKNLKPEHVGTRPCNNNQHHSAKTAISKKLTATISHLPSKQDFIKTVLSFLRSLHQGGGRENIDRIGPNLIFSGYAIYFSFQRTLNFWQVQTSHWFKSRACIAKG